MSHIYQARLERQGTLAAGSGDALRREISVRLGAAHDEAQKKVEHYQVQELSAVAGE